MQVTFTKARRGKGVKVEQLKLPFINRTEVDEWNYLMGNTGNFFFTGEQSIFIDKMREKYAWTYGCFVATSQGGLNETDTSTF